MTYNQPPHHCFYLDSDEPLPSRPTVNSVGTPNGSKGGMNGNIIKDLFVFDSANKEDLSIQDKVDTG